MSKSKSFIEHLKNINRSINSLLEKNLNKLKFNNLIKLARSNKIFLTFVAAIILSLSYLSIPHIYKQDEISKLLKYQLNTKYQLEFIFPKKFEYKFFPWPHFIGNESSILIDKKKIAEIKKIKIYISLENLFLLNKIKIQEVLIQNSNFNLNKKNYNFFINLLDNNFYENTLKITNSNIFFRNANEEVLFINKILNMKYFYDHKEFKNILFSENEIFNMPYSIEMFQNKTEKKIYSKINVDFLRLQVENEYNYKNTTKLGSADFIFNKIKSSVNYKKSQNSFEFDFFNKLDNPEFNYKGKLNFKPFYSLLAGNADELNLSYVFNSNAIIVQLLKSEIFNNKNLNFELNIKAKKIYNFNNFVNILLNSKIQEGLIDIDNTVFAWKNYAVFELFDSLIYIKDGELILDGTTKINILNHKDMYKFLLTPKKLRKKIQQIDLNYTYNFDQKIIGIKDIRIDNKYNQSVNKILNNISIKNDDLQNKIYFKNLLNEAIKNYAG